MHGELGHHWSKLAVNPDLGQRTPGLECDNTKDPSSGLGPTRYHRCVHAAEFWQAELPVGWSCSGLKPRDSLDVLSWECVDGVIPRIRSTGLNTGRGLRNLIDADGRWKSLQLLVDGARAPTYSQTVSFKNPIRFYPLGSAIPAELQADGEVIAIDAGNGVRELANGIRILGQNVSVVTLGSGQLNITASGAIPINCRVDPTDGDPNAGTDGTATGRSILCIGASRSYFEANLSGTSSIQLLTTSDTARRNIYRNLRLNRPESSIRVARFYGSDHLVQNLELKCGRIGSAPTGALTFDAYHSQIQRAWIDLCRSVGIQIRSDYQLIRELTVSNSGDTSIAAVIFDTPAQGATLADSKIVNNYEAGIRISSRGHSLINVLTAHNASQGIVFVGTSEPSDATSRDARLVNVMSYANSSAGILLGGNPNSILLNVLSLNNLNSGVYLSNTFEGLDLVDLTLSNNGAWDLSSNGTGSSEFWGNLVVPIAGTGCIDLGGGGDWGFDVSCNLSGTSATQAVSHRPTLVEFQDFFTDVSEDSINSSHLLGKASSPAGVDFANFEFPFRFFTKDLNIANTLQRNRWSSGAGKVIDLSLKGELSNLFYDRSQYFDQQNSQFQPGSACPNSLDELVIHRAIVEAISIDGDDDGICELAETCTEGAPIEFLRLATEIIGDLKGNENGLCERGEDCLYRPNFGIYQGRGSLSEACLNPGPDSSWSMTTIRALEN